MAKEDNFSQAVTHALFGRSSLWERILVHTITGATLVFLVCVVLTMNASERAARDAYAGLEVCGRTHSPDCLVLVDGVLEPELSRDRGAPAKSRFEVEGGTASRVVEASTDDVSEPVQGMMLDGELVGIQDSTGDRFPVAGASVHPAYVVVLIACVAAGVGSGVILSVTHRRRTAAAGARKKGNGA